MIKLRKPRITPETKKQIIKAYKDKKPVLTIAKEFNISLGTIYRVIKGQ